MRAYEFVPYVPTAQFILPAAYRTNLSGVIVAPIQPHVERREEIAVDPLVVRHAHHDGSVSPRAEGTVRPELVEGRTALAAG
jgi:hypothetical protein